MSAPRGPRRLARPEAVDALIPDAMRDVRGEALRGVGLPPEAWPVVHDLAALFESYAINRLALERRCSLAESCQALGASRKAHGLRVARWWRAWRRLQAGRGKERSVGRAPAAGAHLTQVNTREAA